MTSAQKPNSQIEPGLSKKITQTFFWKEWRLLIQKFNQIHQTTQIASEDVAQIIWNSFNIDRHIYVANI